MEKTKDSSDSNHKASSPQCSEQSSSTEVNSQNASSNLSEINQSRIVTGQDNIIGDNNTVVTNNYDSHFSKELPKALSEIYLEKINIDSDIIDNINTDLEAISEISKVGLLSENEKSNLNLIKKQIRELDIGQLNAKLKEINAIAKNLFKACKRQLIARNGIGFLNDGDFFDCTNQYLELIEQLQIELEEASEIAEWLDDHRERIAKKFGRAAMENFPELKSQLLENEVGYFYFSINQFLEQIAHCIRWGRPNILDKPDIPIQINATVYIEVFQLIKKDLPPYISEEAKSQIYEYVDYLIEQFPLY